MKAFLPSLAIFLALSATRVLAQDIHAGALPAGMKGNYETVEAPILKVYAAQHNGFKYQSYVVKWHDQEVVVPNMFSGSDEKKVGDKITFIAQEMEMPVMGKQMKIIQFMSMDFTSMIKGMKGSFGNPAKGSTP